MGESGTSAPAPARPAPARPAPEVPPALRVALDGYLAHLTVERGCPPTRSPRTAATSRGTSSTSRAPVASASGT